MFKEVGSAADTVTCAVFPPVFTASAAAAGPYGEGSVGSHSHWAVWGVRALPQLGRATVTAARTALGQAAQKQGGKFAITPRWPFLLL